MRTGLTLDSFIPRVEGASLAADLRMTLGFSSTHVIAFSDQLSFRCSLEKLASLVVEIPLQEEMNIESHPTIQATHVIDSDHDRAHCKIVQTSLG